MAQPRKVKSEYNGFNHGLEPVEPENYCQAFNMHCKFIQRKTN